MARRYVAIDSDSDDDFEQPIRRPRNFRNRINMDLDDFVNHFRLTRGTVEEIAILIGPHISPTSNRNFSLSTIQQILIALQFYGSDGLYRLVGLAHGVSTQTVCTVVHAVTTAIVTHIMPNIVKWPDNDAERQDIPNRFYLCFGQFSLRYGMC